jgi:trk system potassium uptake protein TrkA
VTTAVEHDAIRDTMLVGDGTAIAFELTIPAGSVGVGRTVMELAARPDFPKSGVFAALYRSGVASKHRAARRSSIPARPSCWLRNERTSAARSWR